MTFEARLDAGRGHTLRLSAHDNMSDASATLPQGAYTTFRTYDTRRVLRLAQHLRRLESSFALLRPEVARASIDDASAAGAIADALWACDHDESRVRLTYAAPTLYVSVEPFIALPDSDYDSGVACATLALRRDNPHAKSTGFITQAEQARRALPADVNEGLMIDADGTVLEGLSSNFFALLDGTLFTEDARVLSGVTRAILLEVAAGLAPVVLRGIDRASLPAISEAFITSVSREVLPVTVIDGHKVGAGVPGPLTRALIAAFGALVEREAVALW